MYFSHPVLRWDSKEVGERLVEVLGESWAEVVLLWAQLVARLPHDGVDDIEPWHLVLHAALLGGGRGGRAGRVRMTLRQLPNASYAVHAEVHVHVHICGIPLI